MSDKPLLHQVLLQLIINLHPSRSGNILAGVHSFLNGLLLSWSDDLDGVALCYSGERILSTQAPLHPFFSYLQVYVRATFLLYKPVDGTLQCGRVSKVGSDFLALLVLGVFSVAIGAADIRDDLQPDDQEGKWQSVGHAQHSIKEGDLVRFTVLRSSHDAGIFSLQGSLLDPATGSVTFLDSQQAAQPRKPKKRRPSAAAATATPQPAAPSEAPLAGAGRTGDPAAAPRRPRTQPSGKPQKGEHKRGAGPLRTQGPVDAPAGAAQHAQQGTGDEPPKKRRTKRRDPAAAAAAPRGAPGPAAATVDQAESHAAAATPAPKAEKGEKKQDPRGPAAAQADAPTQAAPISLPDPEPAAQKQKKEKRREKRQQQAEAGDLQDPQKPSQDQPTDGGENTAAHQSPPHRKHKRRKHSDGAGVLGSAKADGNDASEADPAVAPELPRKQKKHKQRPSV